MGIYLKPLLGLFKELSVHFQLVAGMCVAAVIKGGTRFLADDADRLAPRLRRMVASSAVLAVAPLLHAVANLVNGLGERLIPHVRRRGWLLVIFGGGGFGFFGGGGRGVM